jgi:hypothetical protein
MIEIPLTHDRVAFIDDEDWELVKDYKWHVNFDHGNEYAKTSIKKADGKRTTLKMHRLILGLTDPSQHVDHKNHNGLDNRRENIHVCSIAENNRNKRRGK